VIVVALILCLPGTALSQTPELAFRAEELGFASGDAVFAGTLSFPSGPGPYPAVILLSGQGQQDRDWSFNRGTYKMARALADHLNQHGIAVYRYDDRGTGKSTGTPESETGFPDLTTDVTTAVDSLRQRDDISQVGLCGHSLGGILAVRAAAIHKDIDFIISLAGSFRPGEEIMREQARTMKRWRTSASQTDEEVAANGERFVDCLTHYFETDRDIGAVKAILRDLITFQIDTLPAQIMEENLKHYKDVEEFKQKSFEGALRYYTSAHRRSFVLYSAATDLPKVSCPVAVIFGDKDKHVTVASNRPPMMRSLVEAQTCDFTLRIIADADHGFSSPDLVAQGKMLPEVLDFISNWILARAN